MLRAASSRHQRLTVTGAQCSSPRRLPARSRGNCGFVPGASAWPDTNRTVAVRRVANTASSSDDGGITKKNLRGASADGEARDTTYAVAVVTPNTNNDGSTNIATRELSLQEIVREMPGTHPRDFFSLSLTSLGDASRKRRALRTHHSVRGNIHPWFILPRESEIVVSRRCA